MIQNADSYQFRLKSQEEKEIQWYHVLSFMYHTKSLKDNHILK